MERRKYADHGISLKKALNYNHNDGKRYDDERTMSAVHENDDGDDDDEDGDDDDDDNDDDNDNDDDEDDEEEEKETKLGMPRQMLSLS